MDGLFAHSTADHLFEKLRRDFDAFYKNPSEDGIFSILFPLYHLRDWIYSEGYENYQKKPIHSWTKAELFHNTLYKMEEYQIVRGLWNNAKHFTDNANLNEQTCTLIGARCGLSKCGDSLGITHYLIDGREIRDIFWPVYIAYFEYFDQQDRKSITASPDSRI